MRVLILTQHFAPEITAGSFRVEAFARALSGRGHEVDVVCPAPNHPTGLVAPGYRGPRTTRTVAGARVTYYRTPTAKRKTLLRRAAYYGTYAMLATAAGVLRRRPDVILASSPPLPVAGAGALIARRRRIPLVLDVRDLWPESAVDLGELGEGRILRAAERLERDAYASAARIVTANEAFAERIRAKAPAAAVIEVVPNGTSAEWLRAGGADANRAAVSLPEDRFVWAYAGNVGLAHGLEAVADAAELLGPEFHLLVIGEGPRRAALEQRAQSLQGLELRPLMAPADAAKHLRAADAVLVSERQDATISAKLYDTCAIGRPMVAACRGRLRTLIEREGLGLAVPHGDSQALADAVRRLRSDPTLADELVARARAFAGENLRDRHAEKLAEIVEATAAAA